MATIERYRGKWRARIRRKRAGQRSETFGTRAEAIAWARDIEARMDRGIYRDMRQAEATSLYDALDRYLLEVAPRKKGAKAETNRIRWWQRSEIAHRSLADIRGMDLAEIKNERLEDGLSASTIRNDFTVLSHLYTVARKEWGMEGLINPVEDVMLPRLGPGRDRRLGPDEEEHYLNQADRDMTDFFCLAIETAMRRGELATLPRSAVDFRARVAKVLDTKNGTDREVPLSTRAIKVLRARPIRIDGRIFGMTPDAVTHRHTEICRLAEIENLHVHDLRHEATSRLFERGNLNIMEIASITGHKTLAMMMRYTHPRAKDIAEKLR